MSIRYPNVGEKFKCVARRGEWDGRCDIGSILTIVSYDDWKVQWQREWSYDLGRTFFYFDGKNRIGAHCRESNELKSFWDSFMCQKHFE